MITLYTSKTAPVKEKLTYSNLASDCRKNYLSSIFKKPSDTELDRFNALFRRVKKDVNTTVGITLGILFGAIIGLIIIIIAGYSIYSAPTDMVLSQGVLFATPDEKEALAASGELYAPYYDEKIIAGTTIAAIFHCAIAFICILESIWSFNNSFLVYKSIWKATDIFVCNSGATSNETFNRISRCRQNIEYEIFRPRHCKDTDAYSTVIRDKHEVYVVYSGKTKSAVIIDPDLYD